jgi:hypothetical protein
MKTEPIEKTQEQLEKSLIKTISNLLVKNGLDENCANPVAETIVSSFSKKIDDPINLEYVIEKIRRSSTWKEPVNLKAYCFYWEYPESWSYGARKPKVYAYNEEEARKYVEEYITEEIYYEEGRQFSIGTIKFLGVEDINIESGYNLTDTDFVARG